MNFRFPREERLKSKKLIDSLFQKADRSFQPPLIAVWKLMPLTESLSAQVGFSVPKKHYKRAVTRNLIKRRLREAYRLQKQVLQDALIAKDKQIAILFITSKTDNISYDELSAKMMLLLRDIAANIKRVQ
ncbi:MAG: ribonuclease P protein component [Flavobacteriales bacterium]